MADSINLGFSQIQQFDTVWLKTISIHLIIRPLKGTKIDILHHINPNKTPVIKLINNNQMAKLTLFIQPNCPFCKKAFAYIDELKQEDKYKAIDIEIVDELVEVERADTFDYYYVPTFYLGDKKLHEGGIYLNEVKALFDSVL